MNTHALRVLGVDACRDGWVGLALARRFDGAYLSSDIAELVASAERDGAVQVIGIDIPIGLVERGLRPADVEARDLLRPRGATLFMTPIRAALLAESHAEAIRVSRAAGGPGISAQAYALREKIRQVDRWPDRLHRQVIEVHPELAFRELAGEVVLCPKKSWDGQHRRLALLAGVGIELPTSLGTVGRVAPDDLIDAAAVAWTALRYARGQAIAVPADPEQLPDGTRCAIWR